MDRLLFVNMTKNRKISSFLLLLLCAMCYSQIAFNVEYEADYKLNYKLSSKENAPTYETTFALLIGKQESYFKNMNQYVADSLTLSKKLFETSNVQNDIVNYSKYQNDFPENIGMTNSKIYVSLGIKRKNFKYEELNNTEWKLVNEYKKIGNLNCQKAITTKYGRKWVAFFSEDIPFQYGPYKFGNLPGLIIELFDNKKDYHFIMYSFKKRKYICKSANMYTNAELVGKSKIFNYKKNIKTNPNRFDAFIDDVETLRELRMKSMELVKYYNPIELEIE